MVWEGRMRAVLADQSIVVSITIISFCHAAADMNENVKSSMELQANAEWIGLVGH